ncbi:uncharacterized protein LOC114127281 [Aphis gossypii]|uniref:Prothoracicotropic hormone n=1 Tax=Aphis gossypii TaxID=80765 RepID=A0A9P0IYW8_APHGO|nr:uncharacterized protein LOC114127281 [Aphis gossypii]CAH1722941.1 unnamed protein product [Aphis gossypii]
MNVVLGSISIWTLYALVSCVSVSCLSMAKKVRWELVYDPMPNEDTFDRFTAADHYAAVNMIQQRDEQQRQRDEQQQQQQLWRHRDKQQKRHHHRQLQQQKRDEWQQRRSSSNSESRFVDSVSVPASEICNCTQKTTIHRLTQNHYPKELLSVTCSGNWCKTASYLVPVLLKSNTQSVDNQEDLPDELQQNINHWMFDPVSIPVACYCSIK